MTGYYQILDFVSWPIMRDLKDANGNPVFLSPLPPQEDTAVEKRPRDRIGSWSSTGGGWM